MYLCVLVVAVVVVVVRGDEIKQFFAAGADFFTETNLGVEMRCRGRRVEIPGHPSSTDGIETHSLPLYLRLWMMQDKGHGCGCGRVEKALPTLFRRRESQYL